MPISKVLELIQNFEELWLVFLVYVAYLHLFESVYIQEFIFVSLNRLLISYLLETATCQIVVCKIDKIG